VYEKTISELSLLQNKNKEAKWKSKCAKRLFTMGVDGVVSRTIRRSKTYPPKKIILHKRHKKPKQPE
jgi:hypothetical protein